MTRAKSWSSRGSFPLMSLAAHYRVDYADVLLMAEDLRAWYRRELGGLGRAMLIVGARHRISDRLSPAAFEDLEAQLQAHATQRWGVAA